MEQELTLLWEKWLSRVQRTTNDKELNEIYLRIFGTNGEFTLILKKLKALPENKRPIIGQLANKIKKELEEALKNQKEKSHRIKLSESTDVTAPGVLPADGHLHIVTQAIEEITLIFERIGFTRVRYPEVEWEWYAFESLNMPKNHPARDDFETFFIDAPTSPKFGKMILSPHTSSGQVREMELIRHQPPIRMINIAKCYRPNWDLTHTTMFHQFEGLVVDKGINITHLKGTLDHFTKQFFGKERKSRIRPFHFQFTEPSFEIDITCDMCLGKGILDDGSDCRTCKDGWLELGGAGMVHPNVLSAGKIDPGAYTGFAFGWGVERSLAMKPGMKLYDNRLLYTNNIRFLEQF